MHVQAHLDVDLVAVETADEVTLMLELVAPARPRDARRPPAAVQVVLDRSGSMGGERLAAALHGLSTLVDRLDPQDSFGLVAFDDLVEVVVPAGPIHDKHAIKAAIASVYARGSTDLSAGLLRGLQEARRVAGAAGATVLVLSDGMANMGVTDPQQLEGVTAVVRKSNITTSTIGIGLGYDETLLAAVARGGAGNHVFAEASDGAAQAIASEVGGLLDRTVQAASLLLRPTDHVDAITVFNDIPTHAVDDGLMLELGDLWAGETRKVLLKLQVGALHALGLEQVATVELRYVALPRLVEQTITLPIAVNVVPGDQAAGRIPNPKVREEALFQQTQEAKRRAAEALRRGDHDEAIEVFRAASAALAAAPTQELREELAIIDGLTAEVRAGSPDRAAKQSRMDHAYKSRNRGRGM
ncbi:MAG: VWA domain-containing protein [Solirubrobacterales bacterium]|nr:VWA domain-containing protein [Solirubrobacterales bacterium]